MENKKELETKLIAKLKEMLNDGTLLDSLRVGFQPKSDESLLKRETELNDIEMYVYVDVADMKKGIHAVMRLTSTSCEAIGKTEDDIFTSAIKNTVENATIRSMYDTISMVAPKDENYDEIIESISDVRMAPIFVMTNKEAYYGASAILNKEMLKAVANVRGVDKIVMLPSSVHEVIVMPYTEEVDIDELTTTVKEVNEFCLEPSDVLGKKAYLIEV